MWKSYLLCFQSTVKWWEELPKSEKVNTRNYLGDGMIPLLSLWKTFHPANGSEITAFYLQKTHGQYFTMDSEGHLQKLPISTLWCLICPWQGNTTGRSTFPCHFFDQGRKWWNSFNYHSHQWCHWENLIASYWTRGHLTGNQERSTATPTDAIHHLWMARVCKKLPSELWNYRDELSMEQGITLKNHHIIVPETFQMTFLELFHLVTRELRNVYFKQENLSFGQRLQNRSRTLWENVEHANVLPLHRRNFHWQQVRYRPSHGTHLEWTSSTGNVKTSWLLEINSQSSW